MSDHGLSAAFSALPSQKKSFRVAAIGLGEGAAKIMLPAIAAQPNAQLVAACDLDEATRQHAATRWQIPRVYADPVTMLDAEEPDITVIATPPLTHYDLSLLALKYNSHVYCEKPFMPFLQQADFVIDTAQKQNLCVAVNSQYYQMPIYRKAQQIIDSGEVGRVYHIDAWQQMYLLPNEEGGWKAELQPRRVLFEFGTHAIDLICRFFNSYPQTITAKIAQVRADINADVCINVRLDFPEGRMANIMFNRMSYAPIRYFEMRLDCEKAAIRTSFGGLARLDLGWNSEQKKPRVRFSLTKGGEIRLEKAGSSKHLLNQSNTAVGDGAIATFSSFIEAIEQGQTAIAYMSHAREVLRVLLAGYESAEQEGELIRL
jgi:predicted dehydrogenase